MKLFFKIFTILIFAQLIIVYSVSAACLQGGANGAVVTEIDGIEITRKTCCDAGHTWTPDGCGSNDSGGGSTAKLVNPLGEKMDSPQKFIGQIITALLGLVGSLALIMFIYGGFLWMMAAGNDDKVKKGKETLLWATLGLVVIFSSYALVSYLIKNVIGAK